MKKYAIILAFLGLISIIFATTMIVHTTNGNQEFNLSDITSITFTNSWNDLPTEGLVAYYPFNGNANDESGNGYNVTNYGANLTTDRFGNENSAYIFNGENDWMDFPDNIIMPSLNFSIVFWINPTSDAQSLFNRYYQTSGYDNRWKLSINANQELYLEIGEFTSGITNRHYFYQSIIPNQFNFIVFQKGNNYIKLTINNDTYTVQLTSEEMNKLNACNSDFSFSHFTGDASDWVHFFNGILDDVRIYNRVLEPDEIQALYHENGWNK